MPPAPRQGVIRALQSGAGARLERGDGGAASTNGARWAWLGAGRKRAGAPHGTHARGRDDGGGTGRRGRNARTARKSRPSTKVVRWVRFRAAETHASRTVEAHERRIAQHRAVRPRPEDREWLASTRPAVSCGRGGLVGDELFGN